MATYVYGMKDLPRVTALPRLGLPRATAINDRASLKLKTLTFLTNDSWVAPRGVKRLESLVGKGTNGVSGSYNPGTINVLRLVRSATSVGGNIYDISGEYVAIAPQTEAFVGTGERSVDYIQRTFTIGPDDLAITDDNPKTALVSGPRTSSNFGDSSGNMTYANAPNIFATVSIDVYGGGSSGLSATGFGKTFPAGTPTSPIAPTVTYTKVDVIPFTSYPVVVPTGGSITITWFE